MRLFIMTQIQGSGVPQTPWEPQKSKDKSKQPFYSKLISKISHIFFKKKSDPVSQETEMQDFASLPGNEKSEVSVSRNEVGSPQNVAKKVEEGLKEVADRASEQVKTVADQVPSPEEKRINPELVKRLKAKLLRVRVKLQEGENKQATKEAPIFSVKQVGIEKAQVDVRSHEAPVSLMEDECKRRAILAHGVDLKTRQGPDAENNAFRVNACLIAAVAHQEQPALNTNGKVELLGCLNSIEQVIDEADLSDPKNCEFVNGLAKLLHKGLNVAVGGVGSMHNKQDWKNVWSDIGFKANLSFRPGANNDEVKAAFKEMLAFYRENAEAHFSDARHIGSRELAAGQIAATIGQMINDFTHERGYTSIGPLLFRKMQANKLIDPSMDFNRLEEVKNQMRENPLLAEVENSVIRNEIKEELASDKSKEKMIALIKGELSKANNQGQMKPDELDDLANKIHHQLIRKIKRMHIQADKTGARGRIPYLNPPQWLRSIGELLAGKDGNPKSIAVAPNRDNDNISDKNVKEALGLQDPKIADFFAAVEGDENMLKHSGSPKVPLRLGYGLDGQFVKLMSPNFLLKQAIEDLIDEVKQNLVEDPLRSREEIEAKNRGLSVLVGMLQNIGSEELKNEYQEIVGNIEVTFNKATRQKLPLKQFAKMNSVASIMYENNLRTICSISGTTVDIILSKIATMGHHHVKELLQPLLDHLEGKVPDPLGAPGTAEGAKFKRLASSISFFMQTGKYHTAAEVIGGLFIAARAQISSKEENIDIDQTFELFKKLMEELAKSPQTFFAVSEEDAAKIKKGEQQFLADLTQAEKARMAQWQEVLKV